MSDHSISIENNDSGAFSNSNPRAKLAKGQNKPGRFSIYDNDGRIISIEPPSEEEIDELWHRLENGDAFLNFF